MHDDKPSHKKGLTDLV